MSNDPPISIQMADHLAGELVLARRYADEDATACAFERLRARRVAITCDPRSARSAKMARRLGYVLEGRLRNSAIGPDGQPCDLLVFALTPEDYTRALAIWPQHT